VGKLDTPGGAKTKKRPDGKTDKADKTGGKTGAKIGAKKTDGFGGFDDI
jgi:hypothetical protein